MDNFLKLTTLYYAPHCFDVFAPVSKQKIMMQLNVLCKIIIFCLKKYSYFHETEMIYIHLYIHIFNHNCWKVICENVLTVILHSVRPITLTTTLTNTAYFSVVGGTPV